MSDEINNSSAAPDGAKNKAQVIKIVDIDKALKMLTTYMDNNAIAPLLNALETLKTDPQNQSLQSKVIEAFNSLGILQGAALTYAPYLNVFISDDPFGD